VTQASTASATAATRRSMPETLEHGYDTFPQ
jgi:hypothetical protein